MDPLETRLREALRDDRWRVPVDADAVDRVHAGAARLRRRRATITVAAAVLVLAGAGIGGIGYAVRGSGVSMMAEGSSGGQAARKAPEAAPDGAGDANSRPEQGAPPKRSSGPATDGAKTGDVPKTNAAIADPVPAGFSPVSLTAANPHTFWLLGDSRTSKSATVAVTKDSGATFSSLAALGATVARGSNEITANTVRDLRFAGDERNAWAFGGSLWTTHDAGATWARTRALPGSVEQLETAGEWTYALVHSDAASWTLWRTPTERDNWQQVGVSTSAPASLAVTTSVVALTERAEDSTYALVSEDDGTTFSERATPCSPDLDGGRLSGTVGALWLTCATGTAAEVFVSTDAGITWTKVPTGAPAISETGSQLGARSASWAVVAMPGEALIISKGGTTRKPVPGLGSPAYAGFTTADVGYILDLSGRLFRTDDGGNTWAPVAIR